MKTTVSTLTAPALAAVLLFAGPPVAHAETPHHAPPKAQSGPRNFTAEEVAIEQGGVTLAATLLLPPTDGPRPGIVMVPGSGPHPRAFARMYAEAFANAGFAVISYDKRGSGDSTGSWVTASLEDLARDAGAAMEYLASQPQVDPDRIGLWAPSQGAWVSSVLHRIGADIAFLAVMSGGGVTPRIAESHAYQKALERMGAGESDMARANALVGQYFDYLATGRGRAALIEQIDTVKSEPWYAALDLERVLPSEGNRANWAWVATYDPMGAIETMKFPVLLLFGELDAQQPTHEAVARWEEGLTRAGNADRCARVFPGANHFLRVAREDGGHDAPLVKGLLKFIIRWLRETADMGEPNSALPEC